MPQMNKDEYTRFLAEGVRTLKVATVRADGAPHVTPVWFVLDGDDLIFNIGEDSAKAKHLRRDPRISLCVDDETLPLTCVVIEGTATFQANAPDLLEWVTRIGGRYMGADRAEEYGKRNSVPGVLLVRVTPRKVIAETFDVE